MKALNILVVIIILAAVGVGGWYLGSHYKFVPASPPIIAPTPTQALVGNDKDVHGCIASAGYSWCEVKQKCLRYWEESCTASTPTVVTEDQEIIKTLIKQQLVAEHGSDANSLNVTVSKIVGGFAQGGASSQGGGAMWLAAKVSGQWKLVWDGNGTISCASINPYNFPTSLVPECWDEATQKSVTR